MKKTVLRSYARLIARAGINVQKGQEVMVRAGLDQPEFVRMLVEECYRAGAKRVRVEWDYEPLKKLDYRYCSQTVLSTVEDWEKAKCVRFYLEVRDLHNRVSSYIIAYPL